MEKQSLLFLPWPRVVSSCRQSLGSLGAGGEPSQSASITQHGTVFLYQSATEPWQQLIWDRVFGHTARGSPALSAGDLQGQTPGTTTTHIPLALQINSHKYTGAFSTSSSQAWSGCQPLTQAPATHSGQVCSLLDKNLLSTSQCWSFKERPKRKSGIAQISTWIYKQQITFSSYKTMF